VWPPLLGSPWLHPLVPADEPQTTEAKCCLTLGTQRSREVFDRHSCRMLPKIALRKTQFV
jgi:hypothetical protein